jgi:hypothetical protein
MTLAEFHSKFTQDASSYSLKIDYRQSDSVAGGGYPSRLDMEFEGYLYGADITARRVEAEVYSESWSMDITQEIEPLLEELYGEINRKWESARTDG